MFEYAQTILEHIFIEIYTHIHIYIYTYIDFLGGSDGKESACNEGDRGSIPRLGRSPGEGNGNPLQDPCLENPIDCSLGSQESGTT